MPQFLGVHDPGAVQPDVPPSFLCSSTNDGLSAAWIHASGELDVATSRQLRRKLDEPHLQARLVVLDLRDLTFMDSCGVYVIVNASIDARRSGRRLVLRRGPPQVDHMFALTETTADLDISDIDQAQPPAEILLRVAELALAS